MNYLVNYKKILNFVLKIILFYFIFILNFTISYCSFESNLPSDNSGNNIIIVLLGVVICISLFIINYSYRNPPPSPNNTFIEVPSLDQVGEQPINEHRVENISFIISRLFNNHNIEVLGIVVLGLISVSLLIVGITYGIIIVYTSISNRINRYLDLHLTRDQLFSRVIRLRDEIRQHLFNQRDREYARHMYHQALLDYYLERQNINGFLTPDELQGLNLINVNELLPLQRRLIEILNNLNSSN